MNFHAGAAFYDLADVATDGSAAHGCVEIKFQAPHAIERRLGRRHRDAVDAGLVLPVRGQSLLRAERRLGLRPDAVVV